MEPLTFSPAIPIIHSAPPVGAVGAAAPSTRNAPAADGSGIGVTLTLNPNAPSDKRYTDMGLTIGDSKRIQMEKARMPGESEPCRTCSERRYVDGSDDMGVSFKTPTSVAPEAAASLVRAHEQEHVTREDAEAREKGLRAMSTVRLHTDICPECKKIYVSGGVTTTQFTADPEKVVDAYAKQMGKTASMLMGA